MYGLFFFCWGVGGFRTEQKILRSYDLNSKSKGANKCIFLWLVNVFVIFILPIMENWKSQGAMTPTSFTGALKVPSFLCEVLCEQPNRISLCFKQRTKIHIRERGLLLKYCIICPFKEKFVVKIKSKYLQDLESNYNPLRLKKVALRFQDSFLCPQFLKNINMVKRVYIL